MTGDGDDEADWQRRQDVLAQLRYLVRVLEQFDDDEVYVHEFEPDVWKDHVLEHGVEGAHWTKAAETGYELALEFEVPNDSERLMSARFPDE